MFSEGIFYLVKLVVKTVFYAGLVLGAAVSIATTETNVKVAVKTQVSVSENPGETTSGDDTQIRHLRPQVSPHFLSAPFDSKNWEPMWVPFLLTLFAGWVLGYDFGGFTYPIRARGFKENVRRAKWRVIAATAAAAFFGVAVLVIIALKRDAIPNPEETIYLSRQTLMTFSFAVCICSAVLFFYSMWAMVRSIASENDAG